MLVPKIFRGQIVHTKSLNEFEVLTNGFVAIDSNGKITSCGDNYESWRASQTNINEFEIIDLTPDQFLMPGFVDCHIHAPQCAQIGLGLDMPLMDWLNAYTFPLEAKFAEQEFARKVYKHVVKTTLRCGTTLASYYGTNHRKSTLILAQEAVQQGQRALVGKVCANCNIPDFYKETLDESVSETTAYINDFKKLETNLVQPIITPRFAVSCDMELLTQLGRIAKENDLHIQTHISESIAEIEFVKEIFSQSYAQVYDSANLLTNKTLLAHAVHLEDEEITLISARGSSVAHCPASNTMLSSGLCDVFRIMQQGVKVGLGTDVSAGNSMSIQDAILRAMDVSHHLNFIKKQPIKGCAKLEFSKLPQEEYTPLNYKQAIYLATLGGAQALALDHVTGNFEAGKEFDAILIDTNQFPLHNFNSYKTWDEDTSKELKLLQLVQKFIYVGDERNITKVFVRGVQVKV